MNKFFLRVTIIVLVIFAIVCATLAVVFYIQQTNATTELQDSRAQVQDLQGQISDQQSATPDDQNDENCEVSKYVNADLPDFSFEYDCSWKLSEDKPAPTSASAEPTRYTLTLARDSAELEIKVVGPALDGSSYCSEFFYQPTEGGNFRVQKSQTNYEYIGRLYPEGTDEYNQVLAAWQGLEGQQINFCSGSGTLQTKAAQVSDDGQFFPEGQNFPMNLEIQLTTDDDSSSADLVAADRVVDSINL